MLRVSKLADYGVMIVVRMAKEPMRLYSATELVELTRLNLPTVRKILKLLSVNGVLKAKRGVEGGYVLSKAINSISMVEIIEAIDGPIAFTECCVDDAHKCLTINCQMHSHWRIINQKVKGALSHFMLSELINNDKIKDNQENKKSGYKQEINHYGG